MSIRKNRFFNCAVISL